ncbi:MAG TPA: RodZ domain-containing protein, partial [Actinomycetota bacterium]|nr:RodZ domain-containing protein [Actinomycetota bacterium]
MAASTTSSIPSVAATAPGDSWLEVYADGRSVPLYYDTLATGDTMTFDADKGMHIRLGYPA